jgi:peptidoglycan/LPS O-acetylase OafA/YrhL
LLVIVECILSSLGIAGHSELILFVAGIILWELVDQGAPRILNAWTEYIVAAVFLMNILAIGLVGATHGEIAVGLSKARHFYAPLLLLSLPSFSLYAMFFNGFLARIFSWSYLRWVGNMSYSYYLIHGLALNGVQLVVNHFFPPAPRLVVFDVLLFVLCISFTIFCGALLFVFVEKPLSWPKGARNY